MTTETPTTGDGVPGCAWCGGPVPPSRGTKPRAYCKRGCVQRAHEARKLRKSLVGAYMQGRSEEAELRDAREAKSRAVPRPAAKSRDLPGGPRGTSRDVPKPQASPPVSRVAMPMATTPRSKGRRPLLPPPGAGVRERETLPLFGEDDTQSGPDDGRADTE